MLIKTNIKTQIKNFFFLFFFIIVLVFQNNSQITRAITMNSYQDGIVIEELRLKVPYEFRDVWIKAEEKIWEPWLSDKEGFMGRQIFWDNKKEEALILVKWKNKKLWKSISLEEVNQIQEKFEDSIKKSLNLSENPFNLLYEGELEKQDDF